MSPSSSLRKLKKLGKKSVILQTRSWMQLQPPRRLSENSARSEDDRKLRIKIRFCEVNSWAICRAKADF